MVIVNLVFMTTNSIFHKFHKFSQCARIGVRFGPVLSSDHESSILEYWTLNKGQYESFMWNKIENTFAINKQIIWSECSEYNALEVAAMEIEWPLNL